MQVTRIQNNMFNNRLSFERRLRKDEESDYQKTMEAGFKAAGSEQRIAITHGSVFPAVGRDSFIGSPYGEGAKAYIKFLKLNGFNGNQLGPNGALYDNEISPYNASALNENPLFIDLAPLTSPAYGKILSEETYKKITETIKPTDKNYTFSDQIEAKLAYYLGLSESYKNFKINLSKGQPQAIKLNSEFEDFKEAKGRQTEEEGMYRLLATLNRNEDFTKWKNVSDQTLMEDIRKGDKNAKKRYETLLKKYKTPIEQYQFEQFLVTKQIHENKKFREDIGFKYFSDFLIGCSKMDVWRYKEAFLEGYAIGAFERDPNTPHQTWQIPVLNPRKLFKGENGLNIGGELLKEKLEHALENCENMRIDHALGLIDPFVYEEASVKKDKDGNQIKSEVHGDFMSNIRDENGNKLDHYYDYPRILRRLVLPVLAKHDLDKNDPVWENICCEPDLFKQIYYNEEQLPRLIQLEYTKDEFAGNHHWYLVGSHDSRPAMNMLKADGGWRRTNPAWDAMYLAGYLNQAPARLEENIEFCRTIAGEVDGIEKTGKELEKADRELVNAKFAELFTKQKIQVSFADILGINDKNIVYNVGGSNNNVNWRERISPDFVDKYYKNLSSDNPTALNIPEVLKIAVQARIDMNVVGYANAIPKEDPNKENLVNQKRESLYNEFQPLLDKLEHYANVLKEKED